MVLNHQRFKGNFFNELRVSFNIYKLKKTKAAKRILKIEVKNGEHYNIGNKNKAVFQFP